MINNPDPILTVVEHLKNQNLSKYSDQIYDIDFWKPMIPLKLKRFDKTGPFSFAFEVDDMISLDPTGYLIREFKVKGTILVIDQGMQGSKGNLWEIYIETLEPKTHVFARVRAKDVNDYLKIGIFVQKIEFNNDLLDGFGRDGILFAVRVKLREILKKAERN